MLGHITYLVFEVSWALPVLLVQWLVGRRWLWKWRRMLVIGVAASTLYLSCADSVAIGNGIWTLHPDRILGWRVGNVPIEESIFFLLTNAMVAQSVVIVLGRLRSTA